MLDLWQDVGYALRLLRRNPLFTLTAALSLAIGIGANTTIFTIVDALLLRGPAGVGEPDRLVDIGRSQNGHGFDTNSYPNFLDIRAHSAAYSDIYAYRVDPQAMSLGAADSLDGAERVYGAPVSANYFNALRVEPRAGRFFTAKDGESEGAAPLVVVSYRLWMRRFDADPGIVGRTIVLNGSRTAIISGARAK